MSDKTFHLTSEDVRKIESQESKFHGGQTPKDSDTAALKVSPSLHPIQISTNTYLATPLGTREQAGDHRPSQSKFASALPTSRRRQRRSTVRGWPDGERWQWRRQCQVGDKFFGGFEGAGYGREQCED